MDDFLGFGRMLLGGGAYRGRRLLTEANVAEMLTDQITPAQKANSPWFPPDFWKTHGWGLGVSVRTAPAEAGVGSARPSGATRRPTRWRCSSPSG